jgi:hypothetical protein
MEAPEGLEALGALEVPQEQALEVLEALDALEELEVPQEYLLVKALKAG